MEANSRSNGPVTILVIDDNARDVDLLRQAIGECAEEVVVDGVPDAVRAFSYLARQGEFADRARPALILLDLDMPIIDGIRALAILKGTPDWADIPAMILTASATASDRERCVRLGAFDHQLKPTTCDGYLRLASRIQEVLQRRGGERSRQTVSSGEWRVDG
jgi:CheY-like chemotaxis protein